MGGRLGYPLRGVGRGDPLTLTLALTLILTLTLTLTLTRTRNPTPNPNPNPNPNPHTHTHTHTHPNQVTTFSPCGFTRESSCSWPVWWSWAKPLPATDARGSVVAVLLMNNGDVPATLGFAYRNVRTTNASSPAR